MLNQIAYTRSWGSTVELDNVRCTHRAASTHAGQVGDSRSTSLRWPRSSLHCFVNSSGLPRSTRADGTRAFAAARGDTAAASDNAAPAAIASAAPFIALRRRSRVMLRAGLPWNLVWRQSRTGRVDSGDAEVLVEDRRATGRLIPDVDADAAGHAG